MAHRVIAEALLAAHRPVFVTGAGMSAASGLPVYRGSGGLYEAGSGAGTPGPVIEASLSGAMLAANPCESWSHLGHIGRRAAVSCPNAAHTSLAALQRLLGKFSRADPSAVSEHALVRRPLWTEQRMLVVTQNVDGFDAAAGTADVVEIHGNASRFYCCDCGTRAVPAAADAGSPPTLADCAVATTRTGNDRWHMYEGDFSKPEGVPRCGKCGGVVRPDVVLFGEMLPAVELGRLQSIRPDVCVMVGTSAQFPYIVEPLYDTSHRGGVTANINPGPPDEELRPWTDHHLSEPADTALPRILSELEGLLGFSATP